MRTLSARIARLETVIRSRRVQACRWHGIVIFPDSFPPGTTRQQALALCDAPGLCSPDDGLFIDVGGDDGEGSAPCA